MTDEEIKEAKSDVELVGKQIEAVKKAKPGISHKQAEKEAVQTLQARAQEKDLAFEQGRKATEAEKARDEYIMDEGTHLREYMRMPLQFLAGEMPTEEERIQERIRYTDPNTSTSEKFVGTLGQAAELAPSATLNTGIGLSFAPANYGKFAKVVDAVSPIGAPINPKNIRKTTSSVGDAGEEITQAGFDQNFMTRPLTPLTKNELTQGEQLYRKIGNKKGLQDLIDKGGAQAPAPLKMKSNTVIDTPFFGIGNKPRESYSGLFAVETNLPSKSKYNWTSRAGGVDNLGLSPVEKETGSLVKNIPIEDLNIYRKKWFSNNYKKLDPNNLQKELKTADAQFYIENLYKWGIRGAALDQIINDGDYRKKLINKLPPYMRNWNTSMWEELKQNAPRATAIATGAALNPNPQENAERQTFKNGGTMRYPKLF